jgi:hypothetical protein
MLNASFIPILVMAAGTASLYCQAPAAARQGKAVLDERSTEKDCSIQTESFPLGEQDLTVINTGGGILFTAGMTIDADGAPNAYAPHDRGLDFTANARGAHGWVALVTNEKGAPVIQRSGPYRGYYVSTTSLEQGDTSNLRSPQRYIDATKVAYIALPQDFARSFGIHLGDLAVAVNQANGRSAYAIYADVGPGGRIGEGSVALAKALGMPANPRHGSVSHGVTYLIFPGSGLPGKDRVTARNVMLAAAREYRRWGGRPRLRVCERPLLATVP